MKSWRSDFQITVTNETNAGKYIQRIKTLIWEVKKCQYQKAVKLKKLGVVAIEAIDPMAKRHCETLRPSPVKVPGVPGKSFIVFSKSNKFSDS